MASLSNINGIFDVHSTGAILFSNTHGTSGQILKSNGNAAPTWVAASTVIGGPYLPLSGGTLTGATATAANISFTVGGTYTSLSDSYFNATILWRVSSGDLATQRADARDDATNYSRLHWYGESDTGATSNFRHAYYDGAAYIDVTAASGTVTFGGIIAATGVKVASTVITQSSAQGRIKLSGSGDNYMDFGPYNDNGWGYIESINNINGIYFYTNQGSFQFDEGHLGSYNDAEVDLGFSGNRFRNLNISAAATIGDTITAGGIITATGGNSTQWNAAYANQGNYLPLVGGTMSGTITMGTQIFATTTVEGRGVFGKYNPSAYQHVWSMGNSYKLADNGLSTGSGGNLYGLAWSYNPNYGAVGNNAQSKAGLNHQLLLMQNGITTFAAGSGMWTSGNVTTTGIVYASGGNSNTWNTHTSNVGDATLAGTQTFTGNKTFNNFYLEFNTKTTSNFNDLNNSQFEVSMYEVYNLATASTGMLSTYGTLFQVNGRVSHDKTQLAFNGGNGNIQYRKSWYPNTAWTSFRTIWDSNNLPNPASTGVYLPLTGGTTSGTITSNAGNSPAFICGPNSSYGAGTELEIGGWSTGTTVSRVRNSNGNLHIDCKAGHDLYLNHYPSGQIYIGNGGGFTHIYNSARSPIFYDVNNTGYYANFASNSYINTLTFNGGSLVGTLTMSTQKALVANNYGRGVYGVYTSTVLQHVWSMGTAYNLADNGSSAGNLYGVAWSHQNAGTKGGANNLTDHGMLLINNGGFRASISNSIVASSYVKGTQFIDWNNSAYYLDPASTSNLNIGNFQSTSSGTVYGTNHVRIGSGPQSLTGLNLGTDSSIYMIQSTYSSGAYYKVVNDTGTPIRIRHQVSSFDTGAYTDSIVIFNHNYWRGYVGILRSPEYPLDLAGQARLSGGYTTSDERLKENIRDNHVGLTELLQLRTTIFDWITDREILGRTLAYRSSLMDCRGFIAQEVELVAPELVDTNSEGDGAKSIDDGAVTAMLVKAIQEQQVIIEDLKSRLQILENN